MDLLGLIKSQPQPRDIARDRLKLLLIHDRSNCSPHVLEMLKTDIINAISNYMEIDETDMEIQIAQTDTEESSVPVLFANIPIKGVRKVPGKV
ncbi:MAG: cell division topological specificity factor MinE [Defluviitaleaceae bacterium]|nr:cell division topological specificity factor MinE [Defluviitaleaceae bacterium]